MKPRRAPTDRPFGVCGSSHTPNFPSFHVHVHPRSYGGLNQSCNLVLECWVRVAVFSATSSWTEPGACGMGVMAFGDLNETVVSGHYATLTIPSPVSLLSFPHSHPFTLIHPTHNYTLTQHTHALAQTHTPPLPPSRGWVRSTRTCRCGSTSF